MAFAIVILRHLPQEIFDTTKTRPLTNNAPIETSITQILSWPAGPNPTPRSGRELTLYHIATAFLQNARIVSFDCEVHAELSEVPSKSAPRVIVETPIDPEYCANRESLDDALERCHFRLRAEAASEAELPQPLPVSVLGLALWPRDWVGISPSTPAQPSH